MLVRCYEPLPSPTCNHRLPSIHPSGAVEKERGRDPRMEWKQGDSYTRDVYTRPP